MFESLTSSKELDVALDDRGVLLSKEEDKDEDEEKEDVDGSANGKLQLEYIESTEFLLLSAVLWNGVLQGEEYLN